MNTYEYLYTKETRRTQNTQYVRQSTGPGIFKIDIFFFEWGMNDYDGAIH